MMENIVIVLNRVATPQQKDLVRAGKSIYFRPARLVSSAHTQISARDGDVDTGAVNIVPATVKPFNTLSCKKTKAPHHVYAAARLNLRRGETQCVVWVCGCVCAGAL